MANEAVIIELLGHQKGRPIRFNCADGTAIPKGTLCKIATTRIASPTTGDGNFLGIAASEKVANDGQTTIALYTHGIFDIKASNAVIGVGAACDSDGANLISTSDAAGNLKAGRLIALEAAAANEVIACLVGSGF